MPTVHPLVPDIPVRSERVRDIVERMPSTFSLALLGLLTLVVSGLLILGVVVDYPDVIVGQATASSARSSVRLISLTPGKLQLRGLQRGAAVREGDLLAVIQNPASTNDVLVVRRYLAHYNPARDSTYAAQYKRLPDTLQLGELAVPYYALRNALLEAATEARYNVFQQRERSTRQLASQQQQSGNQTARMLGVKQRYIQLARLSYDRDRLLFSQKVIAQAEIEHSKAAYLAAVAEYERARNDLLTSRANTTASTNMVSQIQYERQNRNSQVKSRVISAFNEVQSQLLAWENRYCFIAPIAGRVEFSEFWNNNQYVGPQKEVFSIVPGSGPTRMDVYVPSAGAGKVGVGQDVMIKMEDFPATEYGTLTGRVDAVSLTKNPVEHENLTLVSVHILHESRTTYRKTLDLRFGMRGTAEIITEKKKLITRLFEGIKGLFSRS